MAGIRRTIHPLSNVRWAKLSELAPDIHASYDVPAADGGTISEEPDALAFTDPDDGETHIYLFGPDGREGLLRQLTGGVIIPL